MPEAGLEPARPFGQQFLRLPSLPIPSLRRCGRGCHSLHDPRVVHTRFLDARDISRIELGCRFERLLPSTPCGIRTHDIQLERLAN
jgi:hypothetical protein